MKEAEDCRRGASGGIGKMPTAECTSRSGDQHFTQRLRTAIASAIPLSVRAMVIRPKHAPEHSIDPRPELSPLLDSLESNDGRSPQVSNSPTEYDLSGECAMIVIITTNITPAAMRPLSRIREVRNLLNGYAPLVAHTVGLNSCRSMNGQCGHSGPKAARSGASP